MMTTAEILAAFRKELVASGVSATLADDLVRSAAPTSIREIGARGERPLLVIAGDPNEVENFRRIMGLDADGIHTANSADSVARIPAHDFDVIRIGTWRSHPRLGEIEEMVKRRLATSKTRAWREADEVGA